MMKINVLTFGIARDIVGGSVYTAETPNPCTVGTLKALLIEQFPQFSALASLQIAVNAEFADDDLLLHERDEVALIPPVSGG